MAMPSYQKDIVKWLGGVALTVGGLASVGHSLLPELDGSARAPASISSEVHTAQPAHSKDQILKGAAEEGLTPEGKGTGALRIEIRSTESTPYVQNQLVGKPIQIQAYIQAAHPVHGLKFAWRIPRGVVVSAGDVNGDLGDLNEGETRTLNLTITTSTEDNRQVHLNVYRQEGDENLGDVAQYNTVPQGAGAHAEPMLKAEAATSRPQLIQ